MIEVKRFVTNPIGENCYLLWDDTLDTAIVDCGAWGTAKEEKIVRFIEDNRLHPVMALQTHMHFDHVMGLPMLHRHYGLQPMCHTLEQAVYAYNPTLVQQWFGVQMPPQVPVGQFLTDGQRLCFGHTRIEVLHTPGHTPGGLCFHLPDEGLLLTGDTLFQGSVGRSDLPGGDGEALMQAIRSRLLTLPETTTVLPGHGPHTTIGDELRGQFSYNLA